MLLVTETYQLGQKLGELQKAITDLKGQLENALEGDGLLVMHNTRFEVDESVRVSELIRRIAALENKSVFSSLKVGDVTAGNYTEIFSDGVIQSFGEGQLYDDINVSLSNLATGATTPDVGALFGSSIRGYLFAGGTTGISDEVHGSGEEYFHRFIENGTLSLHLHFFNENAVGTTNKGVTWYYVVSITNFNEQPQLFTGTVNYVYNDNTPAWTHRFVSLATFENKNIGPGTNLAFMIRRVRNANNTYASRVHPASIGFHGKIDQFGSRELNAKENLV